MRFLLPIIFSLLAFGVSAQTLTGVVVDTNGAAIKDATVTFSNNNSRLHTTTDGEGRFSLSVRVASSGRLTVRLNGFAACEREVKNDGVWDFTIVLQPSEVVENVNVSVSGETTDQLNTAASIAVIYIDTLGVTAARPVDDILRQIAGFQTFRRSSSRTTNPTAQGANLRGLSGSGASRATVVFEGLSINDAFGGWTYWSRVPMISVDQIEIMSGGVSSVYGSGSLSGAISIVPLKLEDNDNLRFKFETSAAGQNTADTSGVLLAKRGKWNADLVGDIFSTGGYVPVEEASQGSVDTRASSRYSNIIIRLARRISEKDRVFFRGNLFGERRENGTSLTNNKTYYRQLAGGVDLKEFSLRLFGERQVYDQTFSSISADRMSESLTRLQRVPSRAYGAKLNWRRSIKKHSLSLGSEIQSARGFSDEVGFSAAQAMNTTHSGGEAQDLSLFAMDSFDIGSHMTVHLSGRFDRHRNFDGIATTRTLATGTTAETRFDDRVDSKFSPRAAVVYELKKDISIYAAYSSSFRAPSLNELYRGFRVGNVVTNANAFLRPETANTFDVGGSAVFFDRKLVTRAVVYHARVSDPVVSVTLNTTPTLITRQRQNVGATTSRGFEFDLESRPTTGLTLNAMYQFVDAKISEFPTNPELVGARLPQVGKHNFSTQASYRFRKGWTWSTQFRAASNQFEDDRNTLRLRGYMTVDARLSYKFRSFGEAFVSVENIFNSRYDIGLTPVRTVAAPAFVRVGLRLNLGKR